MVMYLGRSFLLLKGTNRPVTTYQRRLIKSSKDLACNNETQLGVVAAHPVPGLGRYHTYVDALSRGGRPEFDPWSWDSFFLFLVCFILFSFYILCST